MNSLPRFNPVDPKKWVDELTQLLDHNREKVAELLAHKTHFTWENLLQPLEDLEDHLHRFWSPIAHLNAVMNTPAIREAYNSCLPLLTDFHTELGHNQALYHAIVDIAESEASARFDKAQKMVIKNLLRDFKLSGISLPTQQKEQFSEISKELSQLSTRFEENVLDATKGWTRLVINADELSGLPEIAVQAAREAAEKKQLSGWLFTLEAPSYSAVMMHSDSTEFRKDMYTAFVTRASDQGPNAGRWDNQSIMREILTKRLERAHLLGFKNYAEQSLATKMVSSPEQVLDFLHHLLEATQNKAHQELEELKNFAAESTGSALFQPWDIAYYSEKMRQKQYSVSQEELRAYFPAEKVLSGLFQINHRLFGLSFKLVEPVDTWHPDVRCYAMYDSSQQLRSYFYIDLFARQNKRGGAWMDEYCGRRKINNHRQIPIAYLTCNFQAPIGELPSLLTHDEVQTLFHEFGHCLQHMLTTVDYSAVAGINGIPWDAVELPSQFLENWAWEKECMTYISEHYLTGLPLPEELFQKMRKAKNFQQGMRMLRQLEFALFDFKLHSEFDPKQHNQVQQILDKVRQQTALLPVPAFNRFQNSFSHIFAGGYAAGYYSYKWAEVMASDAFDLFLEKGIFDPETSEKFLHTFLESGGAVEPLELFIQFRGRPPQIDALLKQAGILN